MCGNHGSSDRMCDTLSFGYRTLWNLVPKALFWSDRSPPVMNSRSCMPTCSSTKKPSVLLSLVELSANWVAPALFVTPPGVRFTDPAPARSNVLDTHCTPPVVFVFSHGRGWNVAVDWPFTVSVRIDVRSSL